MNPALLQSFVDIVGAANVLRKPEDILPYGFDGTAVLKARPGAVVFPGNTSEVAACVSIAATHRVPIVTRGSGTGLSGGSVPSPDCLVLCLVKMDPFSRSMRATSRCAHRPASSRRRSTRPRAARAVLSARSRLDEDLHHRRQCRGELRRIARAEVRRDARLRHGPRGRAAGRRSRATRQQVREGRRRLLAEGFVHRLAKARSASSRRCCSSSAATRRHDAPCWHSTIGWRTPPRPCRPSSRRKIIPCTLEFLDRMTIHCVEDYAQVGLPLDCDALLLMETDGHPAAVADEAARMEEIAREHGAREVRAARRRREAPSLATARRNAFSALARLPTHDDSRRRHGAAQRTGDDDRVHRGSRGAASSCRSAPSATWATATCTRPSSPTSATPRKCSAWTGARRDLDEDPRARRHDHRRAWRRPGQEAVPAPAVGRRQLRADAQVKHALDPKRPAEPREDLRLSRMSQHAQDARLLRPPAVHALRHVPADLPDLRRDQARAQQPARPHRADARHRRRRARPSARRSPTRCITASAASPA